MRHNVAEEPDGMSVATPDRCGLCCTVHGEGCGERAVYLQSAAVARAAAAVRAEGATQTRRRQCAVSVSVSVSPDVGANWCQLVHDAAPTRSGENTGSRHTLQEPRILMVTLASVQSSAHAAAIAVSARLSAAQRLLHQ